MLKYVRYMFVALAMSLLAACAGAPDPSLSGVDALTVSLSTEDEIQSAYGYTYATNPFLPYPGMFTAGKNTFLVVRFMTSAPLDLEIAGIELLGEGGKLKTRLLGREELRLFWETRTVDDERQATDANNQKRFAAIDRYALKLNEVNSLRKNSPYSLVILAPPDEDIGIAELVVRYVVNGEYRESTFAVRFESE